MKTYSRYSWLWAATLTLLSLSAQASPRCESDALDPYDPREDAVMPAGPYKGQCQDTTSKRAVFQLSDAQSTGFAGPQPGYIYVANVWHSSRYYVAKIPTQDLQDVIVQVEHFPPEAVAAHVQMRLQFSSDVELIPQVFTGPEVSTVLRDLVFSAEYSAPKGVPFDLVKGLTDFAVVHRMMSLEYKRHYMVDEGHHTVNQYRLALSPAEKHEVLRNALQISGREGMHTMYHTLQHSCVTEVFRNLGRSMDKDSRQAQRTFWQKVLYDVQYVPNGVMLMVYDRMPVLTRQGLQDLGVWNEASNMPNLNDEN